MQFKLLADHENAIPTIARWYYDEWGHVDSKNSYEKTCRRINSKLNRNKVPLHLIAIKNCKVLGVVQLKTYEMDIYPDKKYWLGSVYVAPDYRGQGIAGKLCERAVDVARSLNIPKLHLQTEKINGGGLYAKLNWNPIEQVHYNGLDVLVMEKSL